MGVKQFLTETDGHLPKTLMETKTTFKLVMPIIKSKVVNANSQMVHGQVQLSILLVWMEQKAVTHSQISKGQ